MAKKGGVIRHLLGHHLTNEEEYDLIAFGSLGRMSSFDLVGNIHWQVERQRELCVCVFVCMC